MIRNCSFKDRVKLYFVEYCFCAIIYVVSVVAFVPVIWCVDFFNVANFNDQAFYDVTDKFSFLIAFYIYPIFKDVFFKNGSIVKKLLNVNLIDAETMKKPRVTKLIIRNSLFPIYLINLIFCFKRLDNRTLGDIMTKTRVVYSEDNPKSKEFKCD